MTVTSLVNKRFEAREMALRSAGAPSTATTRMIFKRWSLRSWFTGSPKGVQNCVIKRSNFSVVVKAQSSVTSSNFSIMTSSNTPRIPLKTHGASGRSHRKRTTFWPLEPSIDKLQNVAWCKALRHFI